jgi:hypothetical protein
MPTTIKRQMMTFRFWGEANRPPGVGFFGKEGFNHSRQLLMDDF